MNRTSIKPKKSKTKSVSQGIVHIYATFNNTIITITDTSGNALCSCSSGQAGFKGARKSTPYAAQMAADRVAKQAISSFSMQNVEVHLNGPGPGRDSAIRACALAGLKVRKIVEKTGVPFNGCRPPKERRV